MTIGFGFEGPIAEVVYTMNYTDFRAWIVLLALLAACAGCSTEPDTIILEAPVLTSISPDSGAYGDTVVVSGSGFGPHPSANAIVISPDRFSSASSRRIIVPFGGSGTELRGVVPDGAFTGSVRVERTAQLGRMFSASVEPPVSASAALPFGVRLAAGNVGKSFFSGEEYTFSITAGASSEDYLVVVFSDAAPPLPTETQNLWTYLYSITTQSSIALASEPSDAGPTVAAAASKGVPSSERAGQRQNQSAGEMGSRRRDFEKRINEEIKDLLARRTGAPRRSAPVRSSVGVGAAPQATFRVLTNPNASGNELLDPDNFTTVTADLKYEGAHTLLYVDAETPQSCLSDAEAEDLGLAYDASIYAVDRSSFGNESDINGDGKVAILMTPVVNRMTPGGSAGGDEGYIAGFFLAVDLLPDFAGSVTNAREIFYTMVPDPDPADLKFGNYFPKEKTLGVIRGVLAHEFLHMILFNYRVLTYGGGYMADYMEELWMNEGLAHIAEDLNGFDASNIGRANLYLENPRNVTLIYGGNELKERGADFLFLRHLGDRFGTRIFKDLVQSKKAGVANVEAVTGAYFSELFADWVAACYLDDRGITSDPRFNYSSLNLQDNAVDPHFEPILTISGSISSTLESFVKAMAPEYILYTIPAGATVDFTIEGEASTGRMNAVVIRTR
ncbi:MAG: hypothetical protein NTW97_00465 [Candidatus Krumholzibacteria bacterium]|nr:hypothetical protein [Candidatus Krumholzibacteria bacterium]